MFFPPIDIQLALVQHTQSVSVPIRHPSDKVSVIASFETDIYIHRKYIKIPGTYVVSSCVTCGVCGLFSWSMAAGLVAFSSRQFALTIKHETFFVRFTLFSFPEQVKRAAYGARGAKRLVAISRLCTRMHAAFGLCSWSSWHFQVACFFLHLNCWTIYHMSFRSILPWERA